MPLPAGLWVPDYLTLQGRELVVLMRVLRSPLMTQLYMLLLIHSDFTTGHVLTNYARLCELCTPPVPQKGGRARGPNIRQMRYAVEQLIACGLIKRDAAKNAAQGQLHLTLKKRKKDKSI